jgi:hypothetical protein
MPATQPPRNGGSKGSKAGSEVTARVRNIPQATKGQPIDPGLAFVLTSYYPLAHVGAALAANSRHFAAKAAPTMARKIGSLFNCLYVICAIVI